MDIKTEETPEQAKKRKFQAKVQANQNEYNVRCAELGQAVYRAQVLEWESEHTERSITSLKSRLKEINEKAARYASAKNYEEPATEAPKQEGEAPNAEATQG